MVARKIARVLATDWGLPIVKVLANLRGIANLTPGPPSPAIRLLVTILAGAGPLRSFAARDAAGIAFIALGAALIARRLAGDDLILGIVNFVIRPKPEVFDKASAATYAVTTPVVDRHVDKLTLCVGRWTAERRLGGNIARPDRFYDRLENR